MPTTRTLVVGSRGSRLALSQTELVLAALRTAHARLRVRLLEIRTAGDRRQDVSLAQLGGLGVFVKELERALLAGRIDLAVHSLKDMPTEETDGLVVAAVAAREDARDALVSRGRLRLADLPSGTRVGTGSLRRAVQVRALRPDLEVIDIRGNVDTRIRKVDRGEVDAVVLAVAGLTRLGLLDQAAEVLPLEDFLPAPGQGALAIQARAADLEVLHLLEPIDHRETRLATTAERAFLRRLEGGCRLPNAALGIIEADKLRLRGLLGDPEGTRLVRDEIEGPATEAEALGVALAERLLRQAAEQSLTGVSP